MLTPKMRARAGYAVAYANTNPTAMRRGCSGLAARCCRMAASRSPRPRPCGRDGVRARARLHRRYARQRRGAYVATLFNEGKAATAISGPWFRGRHREGRAVEGGHAPHHLGPNRQAGDAVPRRGRHLDVGRAPRTKDTAFAVMDALTSDLAAAERAKLTRPPGVVPNLNAYSDPELRADPVLAAFQPRAARARGPRCPSDPGDARRVDALRDRALLRCSPAAPSPARSCSPSSARSPATSQERSDDRPRQLRDFAIAAALAIVIASVAVVRRAQPRARRSPDRARRSAGHDGDAIDAGQPPAAARSSTSCSSAARCRRQNHPLLFQRTRARDARGCRVLSAQGWPRRQAALRHRPTAPIATAPTITSAELLPDGSGRALAVILTALKTLCGKPTDAVYAIAITPPARPAPYPFLVLIGGVLGLGAAIAAAGAMVSARAARIGTFAGIATLAVPCVLWHAWIARPPRSAWSAQASPSRSMHGSRIASASGLRQPSRTALSFLAPAAVAMIVPRRGAVHFIGLILGFYDHHHGTWTFVGLRNFGEILSGGGRALDESAELLDFIFGVTVLWTLANVALHVSIGVALAAPSSRARGCAARACSGCCSSSPGRCPTTRITALIWKRACSKANTAPSTRCSASQASTGVSWFSSWSTSFAANVTTNTWQLGFPFMMVVALGALGVDPRKTFYEAASVDGANAWQRFRHITVPHLRPARLCCRARLDLDVQHVQRHLPGVRGTARRRDEHPRHRCVPLGLRARRALRHGRGVRDDHLPRVAPNVFGARLVKSKEATQRILGRRPRALLMMFAHRRARARVRRRPHPVLMVLKKAFEPGRQFALGASPIPRELTAANFEALFTMRGGNGELLFLNAAFNSIVIAIADHRRRCCPVVHRRVCAVALQVPAAKRA